QLWPRRRPSLLHLTPLHAMAPVNPGRSTVIKVSFAASRPDMPYTLAVPMRSGETVARLDWLDAGMRMMLSGIIDMQRFECEAAAIVETFMEVEAQSGQMSVDFVRRLLLVGLGDQRDAEGLYE